MRTGTKVQIILAFGALLAAAFPRSVGAAHPASFTYQGSIKQNGVPLNGTHSIELRITNDNGSVLYWTSGPQSVAVQEGLYRMEIAPSNINWSAVTPYLETKVNGTLFLPREKMTGSVYSFLAKDLAPGATAYGNMDVVGRLAIGGDTAIGGRLDVLGPGLFTSAATSGEARLLSSSNLMELTKSGNASGMASIGTDGPDTSNQVAGLNLWNKSNSIPGSVNFAKYANGFSGNDDAGIPYSNSARFFIGSDNIARWVWMMGNNNSNEGIYFQGRNPNRVVARLMGDGYFMSNGLSVNQESPSEGVDLVARVKIQGHTAYGNGSGDEPYRGALRVVGLNDNSNARLVIYQAPWSNVYQTDRWYTIGYNNQGTANFMIRGDGAYFASSSRELKQDIAALPGSLERVSRLAGVSYKWKDDANDKKIVGFIAEDLAEVIPEAVEQGKYVNYSAVVPVLVEAIKELKARLEELERATP